MKSIVRFTFNSKRVVVGASVCAYIPNDIIPEVYSLIKTVLKADYLYDDMYRYWITYDDASYFMTSTKIVHLTEKEFMDTLDDLSTKGDVKHKLWRVTSDAELVYPDISVRPTPIPKLPTFLILGIAKYVNGVLDIYCRCSLPTDLSFFLKHVLVHHRPYEGVQYVLLQNTVSHFMIKHDRLCQVPTDQQTEMRIEL